MGDIFSLLGREHGVGFYVRKTVPGGIAYEGGLQV